MRGAILRRAGLAAPLAALALFVACGGGPSEELPGPEPAGDLWFVEAAASSGLDFVHRSGHEERFLFPEIVSGGVALFDADDDGDLDVYLVQSGSLTAPFTDAAANRLYLNQGQGRFEDRTAGSGTDNRGYGMGVSTGDYDGDGDVDLYVTNYGPNALLRNDGGGRFTDVSAEAGLDDSGWGLSSVFFDLENDGDLDLFVANYVNWSIRTEQDCYSSAGTLDYCLPVNYQSPAMDRLFRNEGNGRFTDISEEAGLSTAFGNGMGVVAEDFTGDGLFDIFVANDTMMNQLWINVDGTRFVDEALLRGCALDEHGMTKAGMGVDSVDVDDDGDPDLLVVNLEGQTDSFYINGGGVFSDRTGSLGLGAASRSYTRFGVGLLDFDNDGHLDLYLANGKVTMTGHHVGDDAFDEPNLLLHGDGHGTLREVTPLGGTAEPLPATSRAAAFGDVDGDGGIDVLVANMDGPPQLMLNRRPGRGNWIGVDVRDAAGAPALGARVEIDLGDRTLTRRVRSSFSYCAASDPRVHVGVGSVESIPEVRVRWTDGASRVVGPLEVGRYHRVDRGDVP